MSRADELKVLADGLERILSLPFPAHDGWCSGLPNWERDRRKAIDALLAEIVTRPS